MSFASVENYWLVFCGYYHGELLDRSHGGLLSSGNCWCLQFLGRSVSTLSPIPMTPGAAGGRKLEAERQGAERQDEERATGAERPEVDATRRAWRIRLGRSNLPLFHARRLALGGWVSSRGAARLLTAAGTAAQISLTGDSTSH